MDLKLSPLNTKSPVPVHVQLEEQLKHLVLSGELGVGEKLPSIRALAGFLRINRNTVARVMTELEREGYVETRRGSGVFVIEPSVSTEDIKRQRLLERVVDQALDEGVSVEDLGRELLARSGAFSSEKTRVALIECNRPQVEQFSAELEEHLPVAVEGVLVEELEEKVAEKAELPWQLVVTTFFHVQEVEALLESSGIETVALLEEATVETLKTLAALPDGTSVGVVGNSRSCTENLLRSLKGASLDRLKTLAVYDYRDTEEVLAMIEKVKVVVSGSVSARHIAELAPSEELELIIDHRTLDKGGMEMLGRMLRS